ncbi:pyridoxal phosphate-dependent aminotransferase [bacterium]|nr:pyridoxal phosphate-dependent aminotransferase [bacterium]
MKNITKSNKLDNVCYDIRGPVMHEAKRMEEDGHKIIKLNIGNPASFTFEAPDEIIQDLILNLRASQGYSDSKGLFSARKAVMQYCQEIGIVDVTIEDIFMGNGVSELIVMSMQALLNNDDEILIPSPDYPLWTAAVSLSGGKAVHYICDEESDWQPDIKDIKKKITNKTKGIVVINPNNPTGSVYSRKVLEDIVSLARKHKLIVFSDEIYDKILYDGAEHTPIASLADDILFITFNGLSKTYRIAGFRSGWMVISGAKHYAADYIEGLVILASMRLCANVPAQQVVQTALGGYQTINEFLLPTGRLCKQRDVAHKALLEIPGVSCVKPKGALYLFPKLDPDVYKIKNDERFVLDLLLQKKVLVVQGTGFNLPTHNHFRMVFLPHVEVLENSISRIKDFLKTYQQ